MVSRTALVLAMLFAAGTPLAAEPATGRCDVHEIQTLAPGESCNGQSRTPHAVYLNAGPGPLGDITGGRGPDTLARTLARIGTDAAIGNRTGVEIQSRSLREFGATREQVIEAAAQVCPRTHLQAAPPRSGGEARNGS